MNRFVLPAAFLVAVLSSAPFISAQQEGLLPSQALVTVQSKAPVTPTAADLTLKVSGRSTPVTGFIPSVPAGAQVALLIDDGLRESVGRQLSDIKDFILHLPPGTAIYVGYMENGTIITGQRFTTSYESAVSALRLPMGVPGISGSPYFSLSAFVKNWPAGSNGPTARFVLMLTNGVDPYNGSTRMSNQDSPYVDKAIADAQRAGVSVSSIYYADAGIRGGSANFSGQSYLSLVAESTGGRSYYNGTFNPVSLAPYLSEFAHDISETYIATFDAPASKDPARIKLTTKLSGVKLRTTQQIFPGSPRPSNPE